MRPQGPASDARAARNRSRRYAAASTLAVLAFLGAGVAYRASIEGPQAYADRVSAVMKSGAVQARGYAQGLLRRAGF